MPEVTTGLTLSGLAGSLAAVTGLVAANGFFVAAEFALVSVRRSRIDELMEQGVTAAAAVHRAIHDLDRYIAGTQVGITIASLALGWIGHPALVPLVEPVVQFLGFGASPVVVHTIAIARRVYCDYFFCTSSWVSWCPSRWPCRSQYRWRFSSRGRFGWRRFCFNH